MSIEVLIVQGFVGLSSGMILFIVASGLSLIFGVMRVINFAHGGFYMLGAFAAASVGLLLPNQQVSWVVALVIAPILVSGISVLVETTLFRRIYTKDHLLQLLLTYGITLAISDAVRLIWGGDVYRLALPDILVGSIRILERRFPIYNIVLIVAGVSIAGVLWVMLNRTRWGRLVRASVTHPEMVSALGVNLRMLHTSVFAFGCWLAGIGGVLIAGRSAVSIGMDSEIIVQTFAVVVIGGLGSISGALLGAVIIGVVTAIGTLVPAVATFAQALPFLVMIIVLVVRPYGLLGRADQI